MRDDLLALKELNMKIGEDETNGAAPALDAVLAAQLAFQRADKARTIVGRQGFLDKVEPSDDRETAIESIQLYGDRAVVACIVTVKPSGQEYHNLRLFVRREGKWKLLGWANEPM